MALLASTGQDLVSDSPKTHTKMADYLASQSHTHTRTPHLVPPPLAPSIPYSTHSGDLSSIVITAWPTLAPLVIFSASQPLSQAQFEFHSFTTWPSL